jgi:hypothetical protein
VSCSRGQCGTSTDYDHSAGSASSNGTFHSTFIGNTYTVVGTPTLDAFAVPFSTFASCTLDAYVHRSTDSGATWTVFWSGQAQAQSGETSVSSGLIGLPLNDGDLVSLGFGRGVDSCVGYWNIPSYTATAGDDLGVGLWVGTTTDDFYSAYSETYDSLMATTSSTAFDLRITVSEP